MTVKVLPPRDGWVWVIHEESGVVAFGSNEDQARDMLAEQLVKHRGLARDEAERQANAREVLSDEQAKPRD